MPKCCPNWPGTKKPAMPRRPICGHCTPKFRARWAPQQAAIFLAHESILHDPAFTEKIRRRIVDEHQSAPEALHNVLNEYTNLFARTKDEYIKERLADVRDVVVRLSGHLSEVLSPDLPPDSRAADSCRRRTAALASRDVGQPRSASASSRRPAAKPAMRRFWPAAAAFRPSPACAGCSNT